MFKSFLLSICVVSAEAWSLNYRDSPVSRNVYSDGSFFGSGSYGSGHGLQAKSLSNKYGGVVNTTYNLDGA